MTIEERYVTWDEKGIPIKTAVDYLFKYIEDYPLDVLLQHTKPLLKQWRKEIRLRYGDNSDPDLERIRKKLYREIKDRKNSEGTTPVPSEVIRTSILTKQYLFNWDGPIMDQDDNGSKELIERPAIEFAKGWESTLNRKDVGYILDSIGTYVNEYYANGGPTENMSLESDKKYYIIKDTFSAFCERAGINGKLRKEVKSTLFPGDGKAGPLERVKLKFPDQERKGKMLFVDVRFISARQIFKTKRTNTLPNEDETIEGFELDIHAGLYKFLEHKERILKGKGKGYGGFGYQNVPLALNKKIDQILRFGYKVAHEGVDKTIPELRGVKRGDLEKYRQALLYIIDRWNTGLPNRKGDMYIGWGELCDDRGILPKNTKKRHRRKEDMKFLHLVCQRFLRKEEAFIGCNEIEFQESLTLVFKNRRPPESP